MGFQCGAPAANQNAIPVMIPVGTRQRQGTLGKGKLRSTVGGTIYAKCDLAGYEMEICGRTARAVYFRDVFIGRRYSIQYRYLGNALHILR